MFSSGNLVNEGKKQDELDPPHSCPCLFPFLLAPTNWETVWDRLNLPTKKQTCHWLVWRSRPEPMLMTTIFFLIIKQGTTRMLLTRIPFFKEIIVMSFECPHCGCKNNEIQSAGRISEKGCTMKLSVSTPEVQVLRELIEVLTSWSFLGWLV